MDGNLGQAEVVGALICGESGFPPNILLIYFKGHNGTEEPSVSPV